MSQNETAAEKRAAHPVLLELFSLTALEAKLPLLIASQAGIPPCQKRTLRSAYRYLGAADLRDAKHLATLSDFEVALRLVDFTPLRDELAARLYRRSARGQDPFDPVSLLLVMLLRRELNLSWRKLAKLLAGPTGAEWRRLFGFTDGQTPSASGLRYFGHTLGPAFIEALSGRYVRCLQAAGLVPTTSTFPGDKPERGVTIARDGQLHTARARPECSCPKGNCQPDCKRLVGRDNEARFITYTGCNKRDRQEGQKDRQKDKTVFGYRSIADRLVDDRLHVAWTMRVKTYPANTDERTVFQEEWLALEAALGPVQISEFIGDAAYGVDPILSFLYERRVLRMIDTRAAEGDDDLQKQRRRGYDDKGRPLCLHGFAMTANGFDPDRHRAKYICQKACQRQDQRPVPDCPFLAAVQKHGQVVNVGRTLPDGSTRLARELSLGSLVWKARYGRRNNTESRNSVMERAHLKRLPTHGLAHARFEIAITDCLENLRTLARLVTAAAALIP